jgi:hypothetical protein
MEVQRDGSLEKGSVDLLMPPSSGHPDLSSPAFNHHNTIAHNENVADFANE